jgi:hypothetical protein
MKRVHAELNGNENKYGVRIRFTTLAEYADHVHSLGLKVPARACPPRSLCAAFGAGERSTANGGRLECEGARRAR